MGRATPAGGGNQLAGEGLRSRPRVFPGGRETILGEVVFSMAAGCAAGVLLLITLMATLAVYRATVRSLGDREAEEAGRSRVVGVLPEGMSGDGLWIVVADKWSARTVTGATQVLSEAIVLSDDFLREADDGEVRALVARQAFAAGGSAGGWIGRTLAYAAGVTGASVFAGLLVGTGLEAKAAGTAIAVAGLAFAAWLIRSSWARMHVQATAFACDRVGRSALQRALERMEVALRERGEPTPEGLRRRLVEVESCNP